MRRGLPLVVGLAAAAIVFVLLAPVGGCVQRSNGGMDPTRFWKECDTVFGYSITIDNTRTQTKWVMNQPVRPSYGRAVSLGVLAALITGGITRLLQRDLEPVYP